MSSGSPSSSSSFSSSPVSCDSPFFLFLFYFFLCFFLDTLGSSSKNRQLHSESHLLIRFFIITRFNQDVRIHDSPFLTAAFETSFVSHSFFSFHSLPPPVSSGFPFFSFFSPSSLPSQSFFIPRVQAVRIDRLILGNTFWVCVLLPLLQPKCKDTE